MKSEKLCALLWQQAYLMFTGTLCVGPASLQRRYEFMKSKPDVGELVIALSINPAQAADAIGWWLGESSVEHGEGDDKWTERGYKIDRLDGSGVIQWTNVEILRVIGEHSSIRTHIDPIRR